MIAISVRLPQNLIDEIDNLSNKLHISKTSFIKQAIEKHALYIKELEKNERLRKVSLRVRDSSMEVNQELSDLEER